MYYLQDAPMPTDWNIQIHVAMIALCLGAVAIAYWRSQRFPSFIDLVFWLVGMLVLTGAAVAFRAEYQEYPVAFIYGYVALFWAVAIFSFFLCLSRVCKAEPRRTAGGSDVLKAMSFVLVPTLLIALLLPAVRISGESAWRTMCKNNLKQIGLGLSNFESEKNRFPASLSGDPPYSWRVQILPYLVQKELYSKYDLSSEWDSTVNMDVAKSPVHAFRCPSRVRRDPKNERDQLGRYFSQYSMPIGSNTVSDGVKVDDISDGVASTIMIVEACGLDIVWTDPRDVDTKNQPAGINLPSPIKGLSPGWISGQHSGGAHVLLADGTVRFLSSKLSPELLKSLITINGGEAIGPF